MAGVVDGDDAVFEVFATLKRGQHGVGLERHADDVPVSGGAFAWARKEIAAPRTKNHEA